MQSNRLIRTWRRGKAYAAVCLVPLVLSACTTPTPPPEPVTIRFAYDSTLPGDVAAYYELLAAEFSEDHPHVTIDVRSWAPFEAYDVFATPELMVRFWHGQDAVRSLDGFIERDMSDLSDFYPQAAGMFAYDGGVWGIPAGMDLVVMHYNQDLFDAYGVPYPEAGWTWDDFLDRALALRDESAGVYGYVPWNWNISLGREYTDAIIFLYQHGGRLFDDLLNTTRATFDEPLNVEALEWYADLIHRHNVAPDPEQTRSDLAMGERDPYVGVVSGKVGMWMNFFSEQGTSMPLSFDWGMVPLPHDAQAATIVQAWGYAITSDAADPETCWEWIAFLSGHTPEQMVPVRASLAESREFRNRPRAEVALAAMEEDTVLVPLDALWGWDAGRTMLTFATAMRKIANGSATAAEALNAAQEASE